MRLFVLALLLAAPLPLRAQCPDGTPPPCRPARAGPPPLSVAVLEFVNLSRDTNDAYLSGELADELTARLGQVGRLTVAPRPVVRRLRDPAAMRVQDVGRALGVAYLVTGSIRRSGPRLRVTVELVRAAAGTQVWTNQYDRFERDLLALEEAVATDVAAGVTGRLLPAERSALAVPPTQNRAAYDAYARGRALGRSSAGSISPERAAWFERAVALDSTFADAWAALSGAHAALVAAYRDRSPERRSRARAAAERAVALAPRSVGALAALGYVLYWVERDYERALVTFQTALGIEPNNASLHNDVANVHRRRGDWQLALAVRSRGIQLDPGNYVIIGNRAADYRVLRRFAEARADWLRRLELAPDSFYALQGLVEQAAALGAAPDSSQLAGVARRAEVLAQAVLGTGSFGTVWRIFPQLHDAIVRVTPDTQAVARLNHYTAVAEASQAQAGWSRTAEALAASDSVRALATDLLRQDPDDAITRMHLALATARLVRCEDALRIGGEAVTILPVSADAVVGPVIQQVQAEVEAMCGRHDAAISRLEQLLAMPSYLTTSLLRTDPAWVPLRGHPRFERLVAGN
jgi:TolB-like protein